MAISKVDSGVVSAQNGGNITATFNITPADGDVVLVFASHPHRAATNLGTVTSGYTPISSVNTGDYPDCGAWYKVMSSSPDATVTTYGTGDAADAITMVWYILRGVDTSNVLDATATVADGASGTADPASITTVTNGAWVFASGFGTSHDATITEPSGYDTRLVASINDTNDAAICVAHKEIASAGAENPAAFTNWTASAFWYAITVAIRPAGSVVNYDIVSQDGAFSFIADSATINQGHSITPSDGSFQFSADTSNISQDHVIDVIGASITFVADSATTDVQIDPANASFGGKPRKYYIDANGNVYWLLSEQIGLIEKV